MTRTKGSRNADHEVRRRELLGRLRDRLAQNVGGRPSLRELAAAAGTSVATLVHHFGDRNAIVKAVLESAGADGEPYLHQAATPRGRLEESLSDYLRFAAFGHRQGVGAIHAIGLLEGLTHGEHGPLYLKHIFEPTLRALEERLQGHINAGEMIDADTRHAALFLLAPLLVAQLHQDQLGGCTLRPLEIGVLIDQQVAAFVRAFRSS